MCLHMGVAKGIDEQRKVEGLLFLKMLQLSKGVRGSTSRALAKFGQHRVHPTICISMPTSSMLLLPQDTFLVAWKFLH